MTKRFKIFVFILIAGMILSACSSNTETPQPTQAPAPTALPAATQAEQLPTPTPVEEPGQGVPAGYPVPPEEVPALNNNGGYPAPGTFNLVLADGSERDVSVDELKTIPKVTVSIDGSDMEVLGLMDALKKYDVEAVTDITAVGISYSTINLTSDQVSKSYLDIREDGTVRLVVQGLPKNEWIEGLESLKIH